MVTVPFEQIKNLLSEKIPIQLIDKIPVKWEKIGDVVTIVLPQDLEKHKELVGKTYADVLNCKTVLNDLGGITGDFRQPIVEVIYGSCNTETIHKENGIRYKLDPAKVMFSSGNMDERIRMANVSNQDEIVADLFAGIGYFCLPIAVHSRPKRVFACEKNKIAYDYLYENIVLNNVTDIVEPIYGDNRKIAPQHVADRVIMGYIGETMNFLPTAFSCLKDNSGVIHFHDKFPEKDVPGKPLGMVKKIGKKYSKEVELLNFKKVKSYAPGINHYVFDIKIDEK